MNEKDIETAFAGLIGLTDKEKRARLPRLLENARSLKLDDWIALLDARSALADEDYDRAIHTTARLLDRLEHPSSLMRWAWLVRAAAYSQKGETDKALADYTAVIDDPGASTKQRELALAMYRIE